MATTEQGTGSSGPTADEAAERLLAATLGAYEVLSVYVGERLGWYEALAGGPLDADALAGRTGTDARYAREWLELQATYGLLTPLEGIDPPAYALPPGAREVLTDEHSLAYLGALPRLVAASAQHLPRLLRAFREGGGVGWAELGGDGYEAQAALNRPWFEQRLGPALAGVPDLHARLGRRGARLLDVGCGGAWSTVALARAYPDAVVEGVDVDEASVALARGNVRDAGLAERVTVHHGSVEDVPLERGVDVALLLECLHDMPRPVQVLSAVRGALAADGVVVVMDEAVGEEPSAPGDDVERLMYGFSLFVCLPDGRSSEPSAATGTVLRPALLERYALDAGFSSVDVLPIEDFGFFRFYALRP